MNYRDFTLGDWIGHISGVIEDETTLDGNEMRDLVAFLTTMKEPKTGHWIKHDGYWECSECHTERAYGNEYCPDCGSHNGDIAKPYKESEVSE